MTLRKIHTADAPGAIGPYSQAVRANGFLFVSGQIPIDPSTGELVSGGIAEQTERVIRNLEAILEEGGAGLGSVVKATVFLRDMNDFQAMNETYARFFGDPAPARAAVQVARLPKDVAVEIDAIAVATD